ncbi:amidohydrolase [Algoriphagus litoralis]|uniref:amidohydrolase n=1 Tax=Algoriphagus litoralis TaxID=2202829 RepID=UPI000DBAAF45|nr:amidohydrolase [Algoriphagus litoralis]
MSIPKTPSIQFLISGLLFIFSQILISCGAPEADQSPATMYFNGDILTMEGPMPEYADALLVRDGRIAYVGTEEEAMRLAGKGHVMVDLKGKTLLPGFIDGHVHFGNFGLQAIGAQLLAPPDATCKDIPTLIEILKAWNTPENVGLTGWIFGTGFDDSVLEEKRFPTRHDLDQVSTEIPIMITHISGHFAVVNSKGLEILGLNKTSKDPEGGIIRREDDGKTPNGVLEELAAIPYMVKALNPKDQSGADRFFQEGQDMALSFGYTTVQEGRAMQNHEFLAAKAKSGEIMIDVVSYIDYAFVDQYMSSEWNSKEYSNHYRIGGMKVTLDGSPQGRTAWRTQPYLIPPDGQGSAYVGYPAIPSDSVVQAIFAKAFDNNWQILVHANGDAAIDQMIRTLRPNIEKFGLGDRRNTLIHGQYIREDQLDSFKEMDVITSLFPLHTFYWGDWHTQIIGNELGNKISPVKTALNKGLKVTIHTDAPVALPNLMRVVWTAVNRTSRSGAIIGEGERLTPYEALQAITIWSAYQHFEEGEKGSLKAGKLADLVILDNNPLKVEPDAIKDIQVIETIKEGTTVFCKPIQ